MSAENQMFRELKSAAKLKDSLKSLGDDDLTRDMLEGETDLRGIIGKLVGQLDEDAILLTGLAAKIEDHSTRAARIKARVERCRALIEQGMSMAEIPSLELPTSTLSIAKTARKVVISDESAIPTKFWKASDPHLDKASIKKALNDKEVIPGASLSNGGNTLKVRTK